MALRFYFGIKNKRNKNRFMQTHVDRRHVNQDNARP